MKPSCPVTSDRACHHSPFLRTKTAAGQCWALCASGTQGASRRWAQRGASWRWAVTGTLQHGAKWAKSRKTASRATRASRTPCGRGHLLLQDLQALSLLEAQVPGVQRLVVVERQHHAVPRACGERGSWGPVPAMGPGPCHPTARPCHARSEPRAPRLPGPAGLHPGLRTGCAPPQDHSYSPSAGRGTALQALCWKGQKKEGGHGWQRPAPCGGLGTAPASPCLPPQHPHFSLSFSIIPLFPPDPVLPPGWLQGRETPSPVGAQQLPLTCLLSAVGSLT